METEFSSTLLENAVSTISRLPGIGRKTALRLALHLLRRPADEAVALGSAIIQMRNGIKYCSQCHNISEQEICPICASNTRRQDIVCVVENVKDVMSIENTGRFDGVYHVLGGLISPIDGIGPDILQIASLIERVKKGGIAEIILATGATIEADTTNYYIYRLLRQCGQEVIVSQLARGVSIGNEIEYTDEATLARSIIARTPFEF